MKNRNCTLDILRAAAIILVVNCHIISSYRPSGLLEVFQLGGHGVDLFFVLSGWLLGKQLCEELRDSGTIDLRRFWSRRWLRTLPAYYAMLAATFMQVLVEGKQDIRWSFLYFAQNYQDRMPYFSISWSLCVEEHFYLFVAPLLLLLSRFRRLAIVVLPIFLAVPTVCRHFGWYHSLEATHVRYDQCAAGVLLAYVLVFKGKTWGWLCRGLPLLVAVALSLVGFNVACRLRPEWGFGDHGPLTWAFIFGALVLLGNSGDFWNDRLRVPGVRFVADRAYVLYLLHVEAIAILKHAPRMDFIYYALLVWMLSFMIAEVLHRSVERPFMMAREFFSASRSREPRESSPLDGTLPVDRFVASDQKRHAEVPQHA